MWRELVDPWVTGEAARAALLVIVDASLKGAFLLAVAAVLAAALRRSAAAKRHLVWALAVVALVALPALAAVLPAWRVAVPAAAWLGEANGAGNRAGAALAAAASADLTVPSSRQALEREDAAGLAPAGGAARVSANERAVQPAPAPPIAETAGTGGTITEPRRAVPGWPAVLLVVWAAGALVIMSGVVASRLRVRGITRRARPLLSYRARGVARAVASQLGLRRRVRLLEGDHDALPMTWGVLRPALLLPRGAGDWPAHRLEAVLRHELAHVRRRDALTLLVAQLACVLYWPNPLVWLAARRLRIEQEHACDDVVLRAGSRASDYAAELLAMARLLRGRRTAPFAAIAMAHRAQIEPRLAAVLDETRSRDVSRRWLRLACAAAAAVILPLAALEPARAQLPPAAPSAPRPTATPPAAQTPVAEPRGQTAPSAVPAPEMPPPAVMPTPPAAAPYSPGQAGAPPRAVAFFQEGCWPGAPGIDRMSHQSDDDVRTITWSGRRCSGAIRIEGEVRFTDDLTGIAAISPGGLVRFDHDDGRVSRRVTIRPSAGGLEYEYRVDGKERPWDDEGRAWFADALVQVFRTTGLAADERVDLLLRQGGPDAVLAEVGLMSSDHVQRLYLSKLLEKASLDSAQLNATVAVAGRELSSDHHLAEFLVGLAAAREFDAATRATFISATRSIESDHHHRRVLEAVLARSDLAPGDVAAMLAEAQRIGSDHHRAELLLGLARRYPLDPTARRAYLAAALEIGSDHYKRRVFESLLAQGALAPAELAQVLDAAASIQSDHHRAELLLAIVGADFSDPALQQAFVKASADIDSDHDLRRALAGLMERQTLTPEALDVVLAAAARLDSDHHLSELLLDVVRNHTLTPAQRERVIRLLDSIDSETYRGRVAMALLRQGT